MNDEPQYQYQLLIFDPDTGEVSHRTRFDTLQGIEGAAQRYPGSVMERRVVGEWEVVS